MFVLLFSLAALLVLIGVLMGPIPQPPLYHQFADQRIWFGIRNGMNVLSNVPLALAGAWGLILLSSHSAVQFKNPYERWPWIAVSAGLILTALGSAYYHLAPDNTRLVWDRLPMTLIFMSFVAGLVTERDEKYLGLWLWPFLVLFGFYAVWHWQAGELKGTSDLRFYLGVQLFATLVALIMLFVPSPYDRKKDLAVVVLFFGLARLFEIFDHEIWNATYSTISGHTLKHLAAAFSGIGLLRMLSKRKVVA